MRRRVNILGGILVALAFLCVPPAWSAARSEQASNAILENMKRTEFTQIDYDREAEPYYGYIQGTIPILISAPHGAKHYRTKEHRWKDEDAYTSSLALELGRLTGAHVLFLKNRAPEDPNNDPGTKYKEFLKKVVEERHIKFVLDLHGAAGTQPFRIDVGILRPDAAISCPTYKPIIQSVFHGFQPDIFNKRFTANGSGTITCFARRTLGIEAAQVEINARYRIVESRSTGYRADSKDVLGLVEMLRTMILEIDRAISGSASSGLDTRSAVRHVLQTIGSGGPASSRAAEACNARKPQSVREKT